MFLHALLLAVAVQEPAAAPTRVACLGDSITYGARVVDREHNAYPAQLESRLGPGHEVRNLGVGGRTLLRAGDTPYVTTDAYRAALAWAPDVAVVILGTNDTVSSERRANWQHADDLEADARAFAEAFLAANESARVLLCSPSPMFPDQPGLDEARRGDLASRAPRLARIGAALRDVAREMERVEFHDLSRVLEVGHVVDGVHTNPFGAAAIADFVAQAIDRPPCADLDLAAGLVREGIAPRPSEWHGYRRYDFDLPDDGADCVLVAPHVTRSGTPWIWRARFFGHEPDLDLDLLERGFHLAYCDVANLYGAPAAVARWEKFHALCIALGLDERTALEGMSRGGLAILNYAIAHPDAVAALYGDNPVCDFRSWPGGRTGKRSDGDWERCLAAYALAEAEAWSWTGGPLNRLEPLAEARVPMMLVLGEADAVVPPAENGAALAASYDALGGPVEVWSKPGQGHHPHGLHPVAPLRRAILAACGYGANPATRAVPSAEYRGEAAGWGGGTWFDQLEALRATARQHPDVPVVFLGDSITQGLTGSADRLARAGGERAIDRFHGERGALGLGLSGDRTEHVLYRIEHGALALVDPEVIVLQIGVNNVNAAGHTGPETAAGIAAVVERLREREPQSHVLVCGPFPAGRQEEGRRLAIDEIHATIRHLDLGEHATHLDLRSLFLDETKRPNALMSGDQIHITEAGREAWMEAIEPLVAARLAD